MPKPGEHKTVQARILKCAEDIGWTFVPREEAEQRRGFDPDAGPKDRGKVELIIRNYQFTKTPICRNIANRDK